MVRYQDGWHEVKRGLVPVGTTGALEIVHWKGSVTERGLDLATR